MISGDGEDVSFDLEMTRFDGISDEVSAERYPAEGELTDDPAHQVPSYLDYGALETRPKDTRSRR